MILELAQAFGRRRQGRLPWQNTVDFLKATTAALAGQNALYNTANGDTIWAGWRQHGVTGRLPSSERRPMQRWICRPVCRGATVIRWRGGRLPYLLLPYLSVSLSDGRGASQPWLQEAADPMTTGSWDTWVEINPETATHLGVQQDELVRIVSPEERDRGHRLRLSCDSSRCRSSPLGQGHNAYGRYAADRGANVMAHSISAGWGERKLAWGATRGEGGTARPQ